MHHHYAGGLESSFFDALLQLVHTADGRAWDPKYACLVY